MTAANAEFFELGRVAFIDWQFEDAERAFSQALIIDPDHFEAKVYLARTFEALGQMSEAIQLYREALNVQPNHSATHLLLAQSLLADGQWIEGWAEYEWRYKGVGRDPFFKIGVPRWRGEPLRGRTLLAIGDQGYGDVMQFVRFLVRIPAMGGSTIFGCPALLKNLFRDFSHIKHIFSDWRYAGKFDYYIPVSSLPQIFGIRAADLEKQNAYLAPSSRRVARWRRRIRPIKNLRSIGLCWSGRSSHPNDPYRSLPFELLSNNLPVGPRFISLQKGERSRDAQGSKVEDMTSHIYDFADTAALIMNLDCVVTVDTSVAHLAGAMGKPVYLLLPYCADWRWGKGRETTPWYPYMRLIRQEKPNDWKGPLSRLAAELG